MFLEEAGLELRAGDGRGNGATTRDRSILRGTSGVSGSGELRPGKTFTSAGHPGATLTKPQRRSSA